MQKSSLLQCLVGTAALVIILAGAKLAGSIVVQFLLALFIAIICSPLIKAMTNRHIPLGLAVALLLGLMSLIALFLVGMVGNSVHEFSASIPQYRTLFAERLVSIQTLAEQWKIPLNFSTNDVLEQLDPSQLMSFISRSLLSLSGVVSNLFMLLLIVIFMLLESPTMKHNFARALSRGQNIAEQEKHIERVLQSVISYLGAKSLMSILTGVAVFIVLEIAGVQYALLWATLSFLLNYIPNIGSIIAAVPIILQAFLLNGLSVGVAVTAAILLINLVIGNILEPRLMGKTLGLSTLVVVLSLIFWGWLFGTVGMLLSVPLTMALKIALEANPSTVHYAGLLGQTEENFVSK